MEAMVAFRQLLNLLTAGYVVKTYGTVQGVTGDEDIFFMIAPYQLLRIEMDDKDGYHDHD